jgi:exosortase D (VPLPA-CTERM-specific)
MNSSHETADQPRNASDRYWLWGLLFAALVVTIYVFRDGLVLMVDWWQREEYSHGYMIPLVAIFMVWQKINFLPAHTGHGTWLGTILIAIGLGAFFAGELSAVYIISQYGFLLCLYGFALAFFGRDGMRLLWPALIYLIFMIPLPNFLYYNLSSQLQLLSSVIGVAVIRLFDISVNLEGNVIDLGSMQLQVAEACSGLRYLFPLMSFGFLIGYLYRGAFWQRAIIFLSTVPITILMNSFRIGVIGVTVDRWGIAMAQGFLHDFEGWVVFMGCIALLFIEIFLLQLFSKQRRRIFDLIDLNTPKLSIKLSDFKVDAHRQTPFLAGFVLLLLVTPYFATLNKHIDSAPARKSFAYFPMNINGWIGRETALEKDVINTLKFTDYITADYQLNSDPVGVNFYSAWYESQNKDASIHSPRSCIPGGGWRIESIDQQDVPNIVRANGQPLRVNRTVIRMGAHVNVVYFWFEGRDRGITNEYMAKWYIFWDSLTRSRSDGALVRVVTTAPEGTRIDAADKRLQHFLKDFYPLIPTYVP